MLFKEEFAKRFFPGKTEEEIEALEAKYGDLKTAAYKESPEVEKLHEAGYYICDCDDCCNVTNDGIFLSDDGPFYPLREEILYMCPFCLEHEMDYGTPGVVYLDGKKYRFTLGDCVLAIHDDISLPEKVYNWLLELAGKKMYVRTDSWRGYHTFKKNGDGKLKRVIDSSIAIDGMTFGNDDDEAMLKLQKLLEADKVFEPMITTFPPTSNVCVTGVEVWVPEGFVKKFREYLKTAESEDE